MDYQLDMLNTSGDIFIEGAFLKNPLLCAVLAQLRHGQEVWLSADETGTVQGCAYLTSWESAGHPVEVKVSQVTQLSGLEEYRDIWRLRAETKWDELKE